MEERLKDKANELTVLSDNTEVQRRYYQTRFDNNQITEQEKDRQLEELQQRHAQKLYQILSKYGNL